MNKVLRISRDKEINEKIVINFVPIFEWIVEQIKKYSNIDKRKVIIFSNMWKKASNKCLHDKLWF